MISRIAASIDNSIGFSQIKKLPYSVLISQVVVSAGISALSLFIANNGPEIKNQVYNPDKDLADYAFKIVYTAIAIPIIAFGAISLIALCNKLVYDIIGISNSNDNNTSQINPEPIGQKQIESNTIKDGEIDPTPIEQKKIESGILKGEEFYLPIEPDFDEQLKHFFSSNIINQQMLDFDGHKVLIIYNPEFKQTPIKVAGITIHNPIFLVSDKSIPNRIMRYLTSKFPIDCTYSSFSCKSLNGKPTFSFFGYDC